MYIILYKYIEPCTCLNMHKYIKVTYITIIMQYDILQYLSVYTIHILVMLTEA